MTESLRIGILGTGCRKYHQLEASARQAIAARSLTTEIAQVTDVMEIV